MEEYITRAEFEQFKRHMEQKTDEMKAIRVDVHNVDVETLRQELHTVSETWLETLQEHYSEHRADILALQESQADLRDTIKEIKATMATKSDIAELKSDVTSIKTTQEQILRLLQQKSGGE